MKKRVSLLIVLTMMVSLTGCNPKKTTMEHYLENVDAKYAYNISKALAAVSYTHLTLPTT